MILKPHQILLKLQFGIKADSIFFQLLNKAAPSYVVSRINFS